MLSRAFSAAHCGVTYPPTQEETKPRGIKNKKNKKKLWRQQPYGRVCRLGLALSPFPAPHPFLHFPSSLVGYFKPQQAPKPQTTSHSGAAAASWGPAEASEPGALLVTEPEVGGRAGGRGRAGVWVGTD